MATNPMKDFPFEEHADLIEAALTNDVHLVHHNMVNGGFSFAWQRVSKFASGRMIEVSVSFCSPRDKFCRKMGALHALRNFFEGDTIQLPVGDEDAAVVVQRLRRTFLAASWHVLVD